MTVALFLIALMCLLASLAPFVRLPHGFYRVFEFPRTQLLFVSVVVLLVSLARGDAGWLGAVTALTAASAAIIQASFVFRFTPFSRSTVRTAKAGHGLHQVRIFTLNVKQGNRSHDKVLELVRQSAPDIAVFMETDEDWADALTSLKAQYPACIAHPLSNTYGMVLYSKLPVVEHDVRFLTNPEVPSFDCVFEFPDRVRFRLLAVHPEPPVITRDSMGRDSEIAAIAELVYDDERPVVVTGDLNDVAWSHTTRRFLRVSGLLDPREGRGQYNTFHADFFFARWPLDHIFVSAAFRIVAMERLPHVGSDHFPMLYQIALTDPEEDQTHSPPSGELREVKKLVRAERRKSRRPVGHDWEDGAKRKR